MATRTQTLTLVDAVIPGAKLAGLSRIAREAILVLGFAGLIAAFAQIAILPPGTTVPITGQTFGVLLSGAALGSKRGGLTTLIYILLGSLWLPVFAPPTSFLQKETVHFILPWAGTQRPVWDLSSGGYIVGFVLAAYVVGKLAERGWDRRARVTLAMVLGNLLIYSVGVPWMAYFIASGATIPGLGKTYYDFIAGSNVLDKTLRGSLYPYIAGDALKLLLAAMALPGAWALVGRRKRS
ncbi:MAG: biotin transporter BioY [Chloroflexi bacterium]|nr:biotin transporter BioY [Chloroflexota bacterium]